MRIQLVRSAVPLRQAIAVLLTFFGLATAPVPAAAQSGQFQATGSLSIRRVYHTATQLPDGKVLVVGGVDPVYGGQGIAQAELYDSATGTFTTVGNLNQRRSKHTATLLPNGKVLIVGGWNGSWLALAELYDPTTGSFAPAGTLATARSEHTATLLYNGKVLIAGGGVSPWGTVGTASAELYDPATGTFTPTGSLTLLYENRTRGGERGDPVGTRDLTVGVTRGSAWASSHDAISAGGVS